jgi:hypothetical protein
MVDARSTAAWCDRILDVVVLLLATWTISYDVCVVLGAGTTFALVLWVVVLGAALVGHRSATFAAEVSVEVPDTGPGPGRTAATDRERVLVWITLGAALVAAVSVAVSGPWVLVWVPWYVATGSGLLWAAGRLGRRRAPRVSPLPPDGKWTSFGVVAWAVGLAVLSMWTLRGNPDDLFYVNVSQWVAEHGDFPVKDTLFSNLAYPMANWPPVASYEGLIGVVARLTDARAATVEYLVATPVATFLAVLALWRLLRAWGVRPVFWVLSTALVFLLFDGTSSYATPGNLFLTRLWQGKVVLLCVVVPVLLVAALRYVERPTRHRLPPLVLGGIAAVGLSTTGMFLVPIVAVAALAPLALRDRARALGGFAALAGYPVATVVLTVAMGGRSADDFGARRLYRFDASWVGNQLLLTELVGFVVVLAMLLGVVLVPHPQARLTTGLLVLASGFVFIPGAMRASYDLTGLGPTLWRLSWGATIAALVGVLAAYGGSRVLRRIPPLAGRGRALAVLSCGATMAVLAAFGPPLWAPDTGTSLKSPFHWQRSYSSRAVVSHILDATRPGDLVLAPDPVSITLAITTTDVKSVAPRGYYMGYLRDVPSFHYPERLALVDYVNDQIPADTSGIADDLDLLGVDVACVTLHDTERFDVIAAAGFRPLLTSSYYKCLIRR